jgi:hypothetical protein
MRALVTFAMGVGLTLFAPFALADGPEAGADAQPDADPSGGPEASPGVESDAGSGVSGDAGPGGSSGDAGPGGSSGDAGPGGSSGDAGPGGSGPSGSPTSVQGGQSFTPESFLLPVDSIVMTYLDPSGGSGWQGGGPLYQCASAPRSGAPPPSDGGLPDADSMDAAAMPQGAAGASCYVDMADDTALAALFAHPASVPSGTYNAIVVNNCEHEGSFIAKLKGTVSLDGTTYYTTSAGGGRSALSTSRADYDYTSIQYSGCSGALRLAESVTVHDGDSITVSAFFTLRDVAWVLTNFSPGLGGCADGPAHANNVCSGLPELVSYVGASAPTLDTFLVTEDPSDLSAAKAGGEVLLLSQAGVPFSGFLRRFYSPTSRVPSVSYDVPLRSVAPSGSSNSGNPTYAVTAYGDPAQDPTKFRAQWPAFEMATHDGTLRTADGTNDVSYRAVRR